MNRSIAIVAAALAWAVTAAHAQPLASSGYPARPISGENARADLDLIQRVLQVVHPGYDRFTPAVEIDGAFDDLRAASQGGTTDAAMYLGLSRVLEMIRCDHTKAECPQALREWREQNASFIPVRLHIFGDRLFAGSNRVEGMERGDQIVSINSISAIQLIRDTEAIISIDGYTDHARAAEAELSSEYMGSGIDTFMPLIHGWNDRFEFVVINNQGEQSTLLVPALVYGDYLEMVLSGEEFATDFKDAVKVRRLNDKTALLSVSTFINYRQPVDPDQVFAPIMRALNDDEVEHLVVDLRSNGGGSDDAAISLFRHLIRQPVAAYSGGEVKTVPLPEDVKQAVTTWDRSVLEISREVVSQTPTGMWMLNDSGEVVIEPAADHFKGRVTALSSRANASGSTLLLSAMQKLAGIRIVGEPTGGSVEGPTAGTILFCALPASGITVRVPAFKSVTNILPDQPGMGVEPDLLVVPTPEGFFAGVDEVLAAAMKD
jgi:hypothetical protein